MKPSVDSWMTTSAKCLMETFIAETFQVNISLCKTNYIVERVQRNDTLRVLFLAKLSSNDIHWLPQFTTNSLSSSKVL